MWTTCEQQVNNKWTTSEQQVNNKWATSEWQRKAPLYKLRNLMKKRRKNIIEERILLKKEYYWRKNITEERNSTEGTIQTKKVSNSFNRMYNP